MQLPAHLRVGLQRAYAADFGRELTEAEADALGVGLLDAFGPLLMAPKVVHRSTPEAFDRFAHKRDPEAPTRPIVYE